MIILIIAIAYLLIFGIAVGFLFSRCEFKEEDHSFLVVLSLIWPITLIVVTGMFAGAFTAKLFTKDSNDK